MNNMSKKLTILSFSLASGILVLSSSAQATTYNFTSIKDPNGINGYNAVGINNSGQVVGNYNISDFSPGGIQQIHGSLYSSGAYTTIDAPYSTVNDGNIRGTTLTGINNVGSIVGVYYNSNSGYTGFEYENGIYNTISTPDATNVQALGINDNGLIVGGYRPAGEPEQAFVLNGSTFTTIQIPNLGNYGAKAKGINNNGQIVGTYYTADNVAHGFLYDGNQLTTLDDPNGGSTRINGINSSGDIVGSYSPNPAGFGYGYAFLYKAGIFTTINNPNSSNQSWGVGATAINDSGQIILGYNSDTRIATPAAVPVPAAAWLFGSALMGFAGLRKKNN